MESNLVINSWNRAKILMRWSWFSCSRRLSRRKSLYWMRVRSERSEGSKESNAGYPAFSIHDHRNRRVPPYARRLTECIPSKSAISMLIAGLFPFFQHIILFLLPLLRSDRPYTVLLRSYYIIHRLRHRMRPGRGTAPSTLYFSDFHVDYGSESIFFRVKPRRRPRGHRSVIGFVSDWFCEQKWTHPPRPWDQGMTMRWCFDII